MIESGAVPTMETSSALLALMQQIGAKSHEVAVLRRFGTAGTKALVALLAEVRKIFDHVPFEMMTNGLTVIRVLDGADSDWPAAKGLTVRDAHDLNGRNSAGYTIIMNTASYEVFVDPIAATVPDDHIAYRYIHGSIEEILVAGESWPLGESPWICSMATPSFSSLEEALEQYIRVNRRPENCAHIEKTWRDSNRLLFLPQPERNLRRSLFQALRLSLLGATVREEQNQDESKPVDIEINWWSLQRAAIVEVKWLGGSAEAGVNEWSTRYTESRARDGLAQLDDYLSRRNGTTPDVSVMGYLFVFDARRRRVKPQTIAVSRADGMFYEMKDVTYDSPTLQQPQMGRPFRCFLEPVYGGNET